MSAAAQVKPTHKAIQQYYPTLQGYQSRHVFNLKRGFWEAKDTHDDLEEEISKKIAKGYPLNNIIFEDTRRAVLFQNGKERLRIELASAQQLADLLNEFYGYTEPEHEDFEKAIADFKERVPELARGLDAKIKAAHKDNGKFQAAFADFFALCQATLNPNLTRAAIDEMLVQHVLAEQPPEKNSLCPRRVPLLSRERQRMARNPD
jgi:hypothetical protein